MLTSIENTTELKYITEVAIGPLLAILEVRLFVNFRRVGSGEVEQLGAAGDRWYVKISVPNAIKSLFI